MQVVYAVLQFILYILQSLIALYLLFPVILSLIFSLRKVFGVKSYYTSVPYQTNKNFEFGIVITAHEETAFIKPLIESLIKQSYKNFSVYVVADACDISELHFSDKRICILRPENALNSKIKSIDYAIQHFRKKYDALIILDADNLIHPDFIKVVNDNFRKGYKVVQTNFKPKNTDTLFARMDAIGDMFNFFIEREARMEVGLSAAIWGSGVAIDLNLYREVEYSNMLGGFDKKLQSHLLNGMHKIAFAPDAILFDEKISSGKSLENQRTRWISSYFKYFKESVSVFFKGIRKANFNLIYFGLIILRPPLFITIALGFFFTFLNYYINYSFFIMWVWILASFILSFICIIIFKGRSVKYLLAFCMLPLFMLRQTIALFKIGKAKKSFLKTQHSKLVFIEDVVPDN